MSEENCLMADWFYWSGLTFDELAAKTGWGYARTRRLVFGQEPLQRDIEKLAEVLGFGPPAYFHGPPPKTEI